MDISKISIGKRYPDSFNVVIEVPANADPVKYEFDKDSGAVIVDRFIATPMFYPCNYGFIPHTMADDGDAVDVLVISQYPLMPSCVIEARAVGVLVMEDEKGMDEKIIAVPVSKLTSFYDKVQELSDLPEILPAQIRHFFENYKGLEKGKWVKVKDFQNAQFARDLLSKFKV
jgi:inorganic pyrophosphatase